MINRYQAAAIAMSDELVRALRAARPEFEALPRTTNGDVSISGMSLDLHIQHGYVAVSLRTEKEKWEDTHIGDWKHAQFLSSLDDDPETEMARLAEIINGLYAEIPEDDVYAQVDRRHMLYLVAAEAVLDEKVAEILNDYGIEAPVFGDALGSAPFSFFVYDADGMLTTNYCDIVRAHRVTARILRDEA
jgi:hypothetical protein